MKKYLASNVISVAALLPSGSPIRISFSPQSDGKSVFYTSDKDVQWALEHHYKFGKLFQLVEERSGKKEPTFSKIKTKGKGKEKALTNKTVKLNQSQKAETAVEPTTPEIDTLSNEEEDAFEVPEEDESPKYREVIVSDMDSAKDYLAENYEVVRTKLKNEESIREAGLAFGIVFKLA